MIKISREVSVMKLLFSSLVAIGLTVGGACVYGSCDDPCQGQCDYKYGGDMNQTCYWKGFDAQSGTKCCYTVNNDNTLKELSKTCVDV